MATRRLRRLRPDEYTVGWVCALSTELAAAEEMLDEVHEDIGRDENDNNIYSLGVLGGHNIVIVCLPAGLIGSNPAAAVAQQMKARFRSVRFGLMVGVGGGVPSTADIRLGDVVVSQPHSGHGGVVQYDCGKTESTGFHRTGFLNCPDTLLLNAVSKVKAEHLRGKNSHKNKRWQPYAAGSAAAYAKELLLHIPATKISKENDSSTISIGYSLSRGRRNRDDPEDMDIEESSDSGSSDDESDGPYWRRVQCFGCERYGHFQRDCPSSVECFNCGSEGHIASDCDRRDGNCYKCGTYGHHLATCRVKRF
ncbi:hypothetical protein MW887_003144 [Aspergillus wentii]|nr:hypothetical protein MW887_003144 [Aspergillus wentii]